MDYMALWNTMVIKPECTHKIEHICDEITQNRLHYDNVAQKTGIPYYVIAAIHYRESSFSFSHHLHNGDPLTARTVHVPKNRPIEGNPPFTWDESAIDALKEIEGGEWDITKVLRCLEEYNGFGYRKWNICTPYLWSGTNHYVKGKYVADGKFDPKEVDWQMGCAPIIQKLLQK